MNGTYPSDWSRTASNPFPQSTAAALSENGVHNNSVNDVVASSASNSRSSSTRVNNRSDSFASVVEDQAVAAHEFSPAAHAEEPASFPNAPPARAASETCGVYISACAHLAQRYLTYFDGTSAALRFCHGTTVPSVPGLKTPEGYQDYTLAWSGIAFAVFHKILTDDLPDKKDVHELPALDISIHDARTLLAESLAPCVGDAIGSRRYSYDGVAAYSQSIQTSSEEMMRRWVESCPPLPSQLAAHYISVKDEIKSVDDLDAVLMQTMMMWVTSFFPFYQSLKRQGGGSDIRFFWLREVPATVPLPNLFPSGGTLAESATTMTTNATALLADRGADEMDAATMTSPPLSTPLVVPDDDFLFSVYAFCSFENRMVNADGAPRGCVVPHRWLAQFAEWLTATVRHGQLSPAERSSAAVVSPPGPLNTFACVELAPGSPNRHWLGKAELNGHGVREVVEAYEVVPEGLFDVLALRFGSGPKYVTYGHCSFLAQLLEVTHPQPVQVTVCGTVADNKTAPLVTVIDEALLRTSLIEVLRVAFCREQHQTHAINEEQTEHAVNEAGDSHFLRDAHGWMQTVLAAEPQNVELEVVVYPTATTTAVKVGAPQTSANEEEESVYHTFLNAASFLTNGTVLTAVQRAYEAHNKPFVHSADTLRVTLKVHVLPSREIDKSLTPGPGVCGLTNIGNTCYMNSALQALSNVSSFRRAFFRTAISRFPRATVTQAYMQLMMAMWSGYLEYAETYALKRVIGERVPRFAGYEQQDANELIEVLLDHVGEELNTVSSKSYRERSDADATIPTPELAQIFWDDFLLNNKSFVPREFFHQSKTVFTCLSCGEKTRVFDNNLTLGLSIKEVPVQKLVRVGVLIDCDVTDLICTGGGADVLTTAAVAANDTIVRRCTSIDDLGPAPALPRNHVRFPVCPSVPVAVQPNNTILPDDLSAALRECLQHNVKLKLRIDDYAAHLKPTVAAAATTLASASETVAKDGEAVPASDEEVISLTSSSTSAASGPMATDVLITNKLGSHYEDDQDIPEASPAMELEFEFRYLEDELTMLRKPIAWARCVARRPVPATDEAAPVVAAAANPPEETDPSVTTPAPLPVVDSLPYPQYRVWYFLQPKSSFNDLHRNTMNYPAYVEDLPAPTDALAPPTSGSPSATEEEDAEANGISARCAGPLTQHILTVGQALGDSLLSFNNSIHNNGQRLPVPSLRNGGSGVGAVVSFTADRPGRQRVHIDSQPKTTGDSADSSNSPASSADDGSSSDTNAACRRDSSRDGDDERDANGAARSPFPNPVDICTASWRDTQLRTVVDLQSEGGDAWLEAERRHLQEGQNPEADKADVNDQTHHKLTSRTPASPSSESSTGPVNVLVVVCYTFADARVVEAFSPLIISHPPLVKEKDRTPQCSLADCLDRTAQEEKLSDDDAWYCPQCKTLRETVVRRTLFHLPPCLIMCFKRFKTHSVHAEKNNTLISFPCDLDMSPYLDPEAPKDGASSRYRLRSVVYHTGSLSYGHYTASAFNDSVKQWVYYNDTRASTEGLEAPSPVGAYILFYERAQ